MAKHEKQLGNVEELHQVRKEDSLQKIITTNLKTVERISRATAGYGVLGRLLTSQEHLELNGDDQRGLSVIFDSLQKELHQAKDDLKEVVTDRLT